MRFDNDRLSHWFAGAVFGWIGWSLLLFIPIFHLWLRFSIAKILVAVGIGCAIQLAVTPWMFSARATPQNPRGKVARLAAAAIVWLTVWLLLLSYYLQRGWPSSSSAQLFRACMFGTIIVFGLIGLALVAAVSSRRRNKSEMGNS
jgi:heme/copper-type cytochrome/quinol oxidase subunit 2